jgi:hypothetical protein
MLVSTFEVLVKNQLPPISALEKINRTVIQGYFLTIANVNFFPVTVSVVITVKFPSGGVPADFTNFLSALDISGTNLFPPAPQATLTPEVSLTNNKARLTFTLEENTTGLLILQADITKSNIIDDANFEARGYVEVFLSSLSGDNEATLIVTPEHRGTFFKNIKGETLADVGLDQIAYALPVRDGGVFLLSNN